MAGALRLQGRVADRGRGLEAARRVSAARGIAAGRDAGAGGGGGRRPRATASCTWSAGANWIASSSRRWCCRPGCACCSIAIWRRSFTPAELIDAAGRRRMPAQLRPLIEQVQTERRETSRIVGSGAEAETFHAVPLAGLDSSVLGVLLIASSRRELVELENSLLRTGVIVAARGNPARDRAELVGDGAGDAAGAPAGGQRADGWRRAIGTRPWRSPPPTRSGSWRARSTG